MAFSRANFVQPQTLTEAQRDQLSPTGADIGVMIFNSTVASYEYWDGAAWADLGQGSGSVDASRLTGTVDGGVF